MNKQEKLKILDELVLDTMLNILESDEDETYKLRDLATVTAYLKANAVVEDKQRDDVVDDIKKRVEEAKKRRMNGIK